jgi:hypothetical protein
MFIFTAIIFFFTGLSSYAFMVISIATLETSAAGASSVLIETAWMAIVIFLFSFLARFIMFALTQPMCMVGAASRLLATFLHSDCPCVPLPALPCLAQNRTLSPVHFFLCKHTLLQ